MIKQSRGMATRPLMSRMGELTLHTQLDGISFSIKLRNIFFWLFFRSSRYFRFKGRLDLFKSKDNVRTAHKQWFSSRHQQPLCCLCLLQWIRSFVRRRDGKETHGNDSGEVSVWVRGCSADSEAVCSSVRNSHITCVSQRSGLWGRDVYRKPEIWFCLVSLSLCLFWAVISPFEKF